MRRRNRTRCALFSAAASMLLVVPATAVEIPGPLPDPDGTPADRTRPVKVFILMGQSNMVGMGDISGRASRWGKQFVDPVVSVYPGEYSPQVDYDSMTPIETMKLPTFGGVRPTPYPGEGTHVVRGHVMGFYDDEPVLLIKASIGNRSLGWDILPPGSERFTYDGKVYAGYKDSPASWPVGTQPEPINWYAGKQYDDFVQAVHDVLDDFGTLFPEHKEQGYQIAGFVWWQGHKDGNPAHAGRYEQNLVRLIKTLRKEFSTPQAPFVLGTKPRLSLQPQRGDLYARRQRPGPGDGQAA